MPPQKNKQNTENKTINIESVSTLKPKKVNVKETPIIQPKTPIIATPQPVEALENTTIKPEITPKIEVAPEIGKIEQVKPVEPISAEIPVDPKIEEDTSVLNETPKEATKQEKIPEQTINIPTEPVLNEVKTEIKTESTPEELPSSASLPKEKPPAPEIQEDVKVSPEILKETASTTSLPNKIPPALIQSNPIPPIISIKTKMHELFIKAQNAIQSRKRKKLNKVMAMFLKNPNPSDGQEIKITNDQVEKLLHVSDSTATRYLAILKKEGKIKQNGKTGKWVYYTKI